jgi:hypothetical protein
MLRKIVACAVFSAAALTAFSASADDYTLRLKDHIFIPQTLELPAHQKVTILVKNEDNTPAEFESSKLHREKVVGANSEIKVLVGPLAPGEYGFFDDFHHDKTTGTLVVK